VVSKPFFKWERFKNTMKNQQDKNVLSIILILVSFVFLIPGLIAPMVTMSGSVKIIIYEKTLFQYSRSIVQTIRSLVESGNYIVAGLILLFSILVPLAKGILLLLVSAMKNEIKRFRIYSIVRNISKWAMADVFVAGVFVAFLAAKATSNMNANIEPGFYFFAAYCIFSLLALQFLRLKAPS
jgi:paraquat-inducible protein A